VERPASCGWCRRGWCAAKAGPSTTPPSARFGRDDNALIHIYAQRDVADLIDSKDDQDDEARPSAVLFFAVSPSGIPLAKSLRSAVVLL